MSFKCKLCGKGSKTGSKHKHHRGVTSAAHLNKAPRTKRLFRPNLQKMIIDVNGVKVHAFLCTNCARTIKKAKST